MLFGTLSQRACPLSPPPFLAAPLSLQCHLPSCCTALLLHCPPKQACMVRVHISCLQASSTEAISLLFVSQWLHALTSWCGGFRASRRASHGLHQLALQTRAKKKTLLARVSLRSQMLSLESVNWLSHALSMAPCHMDAHWCWFATDCT